MSFEEELEYQLGDSVRHVEAEPDLSWVEAAAERRRRSRVRAPAALGAAAVIALGLGATVMFARDATDDVVGSPENVATTGSSVPTDTAPTTNSASPAGPAPAATLPPVVEPMPALSTDDDPAAPLLDDTTEIYRRVVGDREIIVRRSRLSWADHFGLDWRAPTGSAELCMGDAALLVGDSSVAAQFGARSAWTPVEVFDDFDGEVSIDQGASALTVVRTSGPAEEVALVMNGVERDRAPFVNGHAVLDTADVWSSPEPIEPLVVLIVDGVPREPVPLASFSGRSTEEFEQECRPGPPPARPLPAAGAQPGDPIAAEARILEVYGEALDRTVPLPEEDPPSVDDITGIERAVDDMAAGEYADVAAAAEHTVEELVFTAPDEAWFRYSISTTISELSGRYGIARFDGANWMITRDTICQDISLAGGTCVPASSTIEPPEPDGWDEVLIDYERSAALYWSAWDCMPYPFGPGGDCEPPLLGPDGTAPDAVDD